MLHFECNKPLCLLSLSFLFSFQELFSIFCYAGSQLSLDFVAGNLSLHGSSLISSNAFDNPLVVCIRCRQNTNMLGKWGVFGAVGFVETLFQLCKVFSTSRSNGATCPDGMLLPCTRGTNIWMKGGEIGAVSNCCHLLGRLRVLAVATTSIRWWCRSLEDSTPSKIFHVSQAKGYRFYWILILIVGSIFRIP